MSTFHERRWLAIAALGLSLFLSALDATIVALALPPIASHFQLSDNLASVVTLSYAIPLTLLLLPSGDLISRFHTLPIFLIAVLGFGLGSFICGVAANFAMLVAGRVIQGCFGALIATQAIAVSAAIVLPTERGRAMGLTDRYGARSIILIGSGLLFIGLCLLTLVVQAPTSALDLAWRLLLIGMGTGIFTGPNQTLIMSVGTRETMGAASALSNLGSRLASVCGPLMLGLTWAFLANKSAQMRIGMLAIDGFAVLNLLFVWLSLRRRPQDVSTDQEGTHISSRSSAV